MLKIATDKHYIINQYLKKSSYCSIKFTRFMIAAV